MSKLFETLEREVLLVQQFIELLHDEKTELSCSRSESLDTIKTKKLVLVEALNDIGRTRAKLIQGSDPVSQSEMANWFLNNPNEQAAKKTWDTLLKKAAEARHLHQLNSELLGLMLKKTNDALAILTRRQQDQGLYGANGQSSPSTGSRIVDSA